jgi:hypothetical protein
VAIDRWINVCLPFLEALENGLWIYWVTEKEIIAVPRPSLEIHENRLHSVTGPAVSWPSGLTYWFWKGVNVPGYVIEKPEKITVSDIDSEPNAEIRRVKIEQYGQSKYLIDSKAKVLHRDEFGVLYSKEIPGDEPLVMVKVINSTPEPDGSFKDYFLRVPPDIRRARQAVAWTFDKTAKDYHPIAQS